MAKLKFKEGDRIQFLGILDHDAIWEDWARKDGLVPLGVYIAHLVEDVLYLRGSKFCYFEKYFQKIEPEKEEQWNETKM